MHYSKFKRVYLAGYSFTKIRNMIVVGFHFVDDSMYNQWYDWRKSETGNQETCHMLTLKLSDSSMEDKFDDELHFYQYGID